MAFFLHFKVLFFSFKLTQNEYYFLPLFHLLCIPQRLFFMTDTNIKDWLIIKIAEESGLTEASISPDEPFESFHLDSLSIVSLSYDLENYSGKTVDPTVFNEYKTINELSAWLEEQ
jgi:acyl carrier protein